MQNLAEKPVQDFKIPKRRPRSRTSKLSRSILMIGSEGNVLSFSITKFLVVAVIASLTTIAFVVFFLFSYHTILNKNKGLKDELNQVREKLAAAKVDKERILLHLMNLEAEVKFDEKRNRSASFQKLPAKKSQVAKLSASRSEDAKGATPETLEPGTGGSETRTSEVNDPEKSVFAKSVAVDKFKIWQEEFGNLLKFQFRLRNIDPQNKKVKGYIFVVLKPEKGSKESGTAYPQTPMKDGKPEVFKNGDYFSISRFKIVLGSFPAIKEIGHFKTATVYAYSVKGNILVEEVYEVDKILHF
jgi:hypothetical protein